MLLIRHSPTNHFPEECQDKKEEMKKVISTYWVMGENKPTMQLYLCQENYLYYAL